MSEDQCRCDVLLWTMYGRTSLEPLEQVDKTEHRSHARGKAKVVLAAMEGIE